MNIMLRKLTINSNISTGGTNWEQRADGTNEDQRGNVTRRNNYGKGGSSNAKLASAKFFE